MTPELRHMLRDDDLNHEEQKQVLELAIKFHHDRFYKQPFAGPQAVAVLFDKPSTRTRSSFSIGVAELGGYPLVIDKSGSQLGRGEPVADTARVLDRMAYGVVWRTFGQDRVEEMAKYSTHPVVNALTDDFHPCQILADFQTIAEHRGGVDNLKNQTIAYLGDAANNMANSYLLGGAVAGMDLGLGKDSIEVYVSGLYQTTFTINATAKTVSLGGPMVQNGTVLIQQTKILPKA